MPAEHAGWVSLVPAASVLAFALTTRRTFEALLAGTLVGYGITSGTGFVTGFAGSLLAVMQDETIAWILLVVGLFGAWIALLRRAGATAAFGDLVAGVVRSRAGVLTATWLMGIGIFLDDYLNALAVGASMRRVADRFGIAREKLAYVVDSTAAPVCVLVPLSTWAFYVAGLLESVGLAAPGDGLLEYRSTIPFILYAWSALGLVGLVALGWVPDIGPMKKAQQRRELEGPPRSDTVDEEPGINAAATASGPTSQRARAMGFIVPLAVMMAVTWVYRDALLGVMAAVVLTVALLLGQRRLSVAQASDTFFAGVQTMVYPLAIVVMSFVLRNVNDDLGLTDFVIDSVRPVMSGALLPAVAFVSLSIITFATGSFWGVYAVSLPIVVPLAESMSVDSGLAVGAVLSAGAFGSHACFYGDATVLAASSAGCDVFAHVVTQLPYVLIAATVSAIGYLVLGHIL